MDKDKLIYELIDKELLILDNQILDKDSNESIFPFKINFKNMISYNYITNTIVKLMFEKIKHINYNTIIGIPNNGNHISSILSFNYNIDLLLFSNKNHKTINGIYKDNSTSLIINDIIFSGSSLLSYINLLVKNHILVKDILVIYDTSTQKNDSMLKYNIHSLFDSFYIINLLSIGQVINNAKKLTLQKYFNNNNTELRYRYSLIYRKKLSTNHIYNKLIDIMLLKKTNICFNCNFKNIRDIVKYVNIVGPYICILKINSFDIDNFNMNYISALEKLAKGHNFMILNDINISSINANNFIWAHITTISHYNTVNIINTMKNYLLKNNKQLLFNSESIDDNYSIITQNKDIFLGYIQNDNKYILQNDKDELKHDKLLKNDKNNKSLHDLSIINFSNVNITIEMDINKLLENNNDIYCIDGKSIEKNLLDFIQIYKKKLWIYS